MFYGSFILDGESRSALYDSMDAWHRDTFSPLTEITALIPFDVSGKTYADRKDSLREVAVSWSVSGDVGPLSWLDVQRIADWFYRNGRRYGLLREFQKNGLC